MYYYKKLNNYMVFVIVTMLFLTACHHYYKVSPVYMGASNGSAATIDSLRLAERFFILKSGSDAYYMRNPMLSADKKTMDCILDTVPYFHQLYLANGRNGKMKYLQSSEVRTYSKVWHTVFE